MTSIEVRPASAVATSLGETVRFQGTAFDAEGRPFSGKSFRWSTSDAAVASVDEEGVVRAVGNGSATVWAEVDGVTGTAQFGVDQAPAGLSFTGQPEEVAVGEVASPPFEVSVLDAGGSVVTGATVEVTLRVADNPGDGALSGGTTVQAASGVAAFTDLTIDEFGLGYTLAAEAPGLPAIKSEAFDVFVPLTEVHAGNGYSCGLLATGQGYCWGRNEYGQLGDGTTEDRWAPVPISGGLLFDAISVGNGSTCGVTVEGVAYCWGHNNSGQLGDGTTVDRSVPVRVSGGLSFAGIDSYGSHACGLTTDGQAYCWGWDGGGQLGDGEPTVAANPVPVAVVGGLAFDEIEVGSSHSCAVTTESVVYCWGGNNYGALGNGSFVKVQQATPDIVPGGPPLHALEARQHSTCGLTPDGVGYCWGENRGGQLGDGTRENRASPVLVSGGLEFSMLTPGCGLTIDAVGYCWGGGVSDFSAPVVPEVVPGGLTFGQISSGGNHDCGVTLRGAPYCWGASNWGQLGDGRSEHSVEPVRLAGPSD